MSQRADKLFEDAKALPGEERAILALQLLDSVGEPEPELERAWHDEVRQRVADIDAGHAKLAPWSEARQRISLANSVLIPCEQAGFARF